MSILIKGMEMPKNCRACPFEHIAISYCNVIKKSTSHYPSGKEILTPRHKDCPLVEIPPHGRLIDADALYRTIDATSERTIGHTTFKETVLLDIRGMPTILESTIGQLNSDPADVVAKNKTVGAEKCGFEP